MTPARARLRGLAALIFLVGIIAGMPALLLATRHTMLPTRIPTTLPGLWGVLTRPDDGTLALAVFYLTGWVAWAFFTGAVALDVLARARRLRVPHLRGLTLPQATAHSLVGAAFLLFTATPLAVPLTPPAATTAAVATFVPTPQAGTTDTGTGSAAAPSLAPARTTTPTSPERAPQTPTVEHTVRRGDTLWSIARDHLGKGSRFPEIAALNTDVLGDHPGFLQPGWILHLPATTTHHEAGESYVVQAGDTLTEIADDELGHASAYREIFDASTGITQPGGRHLTDPDVIDVGWTLTIPDRHTTHADGPTRPASTTAAPSFPPPTVRAGDHAPRPTIAPVTPVMPVPTPTLEAPSTTTASSPVTSVQATRAPAVDQGDEDLEAPGWFRPAYTGAGVMLAGSLLLLLRQRRRAQRRHRRPGHTIPFPDPTVVPTEKSILLAGATGLPAVDRVHATLLRLAAAQTTARHTLPDLAAVELHPDLLTLHLRQPADLPDPWQDASATTTARTKWSCSTRIDLDEIGPHIPDLPAPYPLMVTIGATDPTRPTGVWLLNTETYGVLTITGDPDRGADLARYLVAELAANPWSDGVSVDCVALAVELGPLTPQRIRTHPDLGAVANRLLAEATETVDAADRHEAPGLSTARSGFIGDDAWPATVLLLGHSAEAAVGVDALVDLITNNPGRTGTVVLLLDHDAAKPPQGIAGTVLNIDAQAQLRIDKLDLQLAAVQLTHDEAADAATLLAVADEARDADVPPATGDQGWRTISDRTGNLLPEVTLPRTTDDGMTDDEAAGESILDRDDIAYLATAATTSEDLAALAPRVPDDVRTRIEDADPTLDDDVAAWFSEACPLPRLSVLGPVRARTRGDAVAVANRKPYFTGVLAYLATRACGATVAELMTEFGLTDGRVRAVVRTLRMWLGTNPRTGKDHIPPADKTAAATLRGVNAYQVENLLTDADLFLRLRARGTARGPVGVSDLDTALRLVRGEPYSKHPERGWSWLADDRLEENLVVAIVDVAHILATHALAKADPDRARAVAQTALLAAPYEEIPRLDLVAALRALGDTDEADRILRDDVLDRCDDNAPPRTLGARTARLAESV